VSTHATGRRHDVVGGVPSFVPWLLAPALLTMLVPFLWMLFLSLQPGAGGQLDASRLTQAKFDLVHYRELLAAGAFPRYLLNSIVVALAVVFGNVLTGAMVGYALARKRFPGNRALTWGVIATLMVPKQVLMIPLYLVLARLGWLDTYAALILPFFVDAFSIFLVRQYVLALPAELEDAARVDGASELRIFATIVLPLLRPALAVVAINGFLLNWNSFLFPLIFTNSDALRTLPVGLALFAQGEHATDWGLLMAGSTVSVLPMLAAFLLFQRQILEGMTAGAEKG
jgi:multiple sugar transport system permease protein